MLRASAYGPVRILLPMVACVEEVRTARAIDSVNGSTVSSMPRISTVAMAIGAYWTKEIGDVPASRAGRSWSTASSPTRAYWAPSPSSWSSCSESS